MNIMSVSFVTTIFLLIPSYLASGFLRNFNFMIANSFRATFTKEIFFLSIIVFCSYKITFLIPYFASLHEIDPISWMMQEKLSFDKSKFYEWGRFIGAFYVCTIALSMLSSWVVKRTLFSDPKNSNFIHRWLSKFLGRILQAFGVWDPLTQILRSGSIGSKEVLVDLSLGDKSRVYTGTLEGYNETDSFKYFTMRNVYIIEFDKDGKVQRKLYKDDNQGLLGRMIFSVDKVSDVHFRWGWSGSEKHNELRTQILEGVKGLTP